MPMAGMTNTSIVNLCSYLQVFILRILDLASERAGHAHIHTDVRMMIAIAMVFLPFIFLLILAFGDSAYVGPGGQPAGGSMAPPPPPPAPAG